VRGALLTVNIGRAPVAAPPTGVNGVGAFSTTAARTVNL
jgi:hypothetical protein